MKANRSTRIVFQLFLRTILLCSLSFLLGCYPTLTREPTRPEDALKRISFFYPNFKDDMNWASLSEAIERNLTYLNSLPPEYIFYYGKQPFTCEQVLQSQKAFLDLVSHTKRVGRLNREIRRLFWVYRATGQVGNNKVLFTGYYEPTFEARLEPDNTFKYPIYKKPNDLVKIDLSAFNKKYEGENIVGRFDGKTVVPYYSRLQIEEEKALQGRHLEIAWLKSPVDVAFLQIQGSGRLILPDGRSMCVGYSGSNGHPYRSIGKYMLEEGFLDRDEMSMQSVRSFLSEHPSLMEKILDYNPSYVFFRVLDSGPIGNLGVPVTPGRSIALDSRLFPKGALCFISCQKPVINRTDEIVGWKHFSRFVLDQDTGGAIRGAGRADIFWGSGKYAEITAGHLQHEGELYILIKKP